MAKGDYRCCDICDSKVFYDSNLNYERGPSEWRKNAVPYKQIGELQYSNVEINEKYGMHLDSLGDWAVICSDCAKTHKCVIVPIEQSND